VILTQTDAAGAARIAGVAYAVLVVVGLLQVHQQGQLSSVDDSSPSLSRMTQEDGAERKDRRCPWLEHGQQRASLTETAGAHRLARIDERARAAVIERERDPIGRRR
jgi:hypothetical protein